MYKVGIVGYGNLGRALELAADKNSDISVECIFTKRNPESVRTCGMPIYSFEAVEDFCSKLDCLIIAGGSADDLPIQTPKLAEHFNVVDSYDSHDKIAEHKKRTGAAARKGKNTALISAGWDPGILSVARLYAKSFMPYATVNTFWGKGVSQGHSEAIRTIRGVKYAIQYTVPNKDAELLAGYGIPFSAKGSHKRVCYVVANEGEEERIKREIVTMPLYFDGYETEVNFISEEEFIKEHKKLYHRGRLISSGMTGKYLENREALNLEIELDSNPQFTAYILLASARAVCRMNREKNFGAYTFFDVPPKYFYPEGSLSLL